MLRSLYYKDYIKSCVLNTKAKNYIKHNVNIQYTLR